MPEPVEVTISGTAYKIFLFGGLEGHKVYGELQKIKAHCDTVEAMTAEILLHPNLVERFAKKTQVIQGDKSPFLWGIFDAHFAGNMDDLASWLQEAIKANFQSRKAGTDSGVSAASQ